MTTRLNSERVLRRVYVWSALQSRFGVANAAAFQLEAYRVRVGVRDGPIVAVHDGLWSVHRRQFNLQILVELIS